MKLYTLLFVATVTQVSTVSADEYSSEITMELVEGQEHIAEVCLYNAFEPHPTLEYEFEIDFEILKAEHFAIFDAPDRLTITQLPLHLTAEEMSIEVGENTQKCIKIYERLMG